MLFQERLQVSLTTQIGRKFSLKDSTEQIMDGRLSRHKGRASDWNGASAEPCHQSHIEITLLT